MTPNASPDRHALTTVVVGATTYTFRTYDGHLETDMVDEPNADRNAPNEGARVTVGIVSYLRQPTTTTWGETSREWIALDGGGLPGPYVLLDEVVRQRDRIVALEADLATAREEKAELAGRYALLRATKGPNRRMRPNAEPTEEGT